MRVVFDSNIFISAFVFPGSQAEKAMLRIIDGPDRLLVSKEIIDEVLRVLASKFARNREAISYTAVLMADLGELVSTSRKIAILADEPDNRILECSVAGHAELIVTGDRGMLGLQEFEGVRIIRLAEYITE